MSANGVEHNSKRNQLGAREMFLLAQALFAAKDELVRDRPNREAVAHRMTKQLGFKVTPANVGMAAKACGVEWNKRGPSRPRSRPNGDWYARVVRLEDIIDQMLPIINKVLEELNYPKIEEPAARPAADEIQE